MECGWIDVLGYRKIKYNYHHLYRHRLIFYYVYGYLPNIIAHINRIKGDDRIDNLRVSTHQENHRNALMRKTNKSGMTGVHWHIRDKIWNAKIVLSGKTKHLGNFKKKSDAIRARKKAVKIYFGRPVKKCL